MSTGDPTGRDELIRSLRDAVARLDNHHGFYTEAVAQRLGLNRTDVDCLSILGLEGAMTAGRLADITGLTTGGITGILDRLERTGFVRREVDPADRRRVIVRLDPTEAGRLEALLQPMHQRTDELYASCSDDELRGLLALLQRRLAIVQEETAVLRAAAGPAREGLAHEAGTFTAPLIGGGPGMLELRGGTNSVTIAGDPGMDALFRAQFDPDRVRVDVDGHNVTIRSRRRFSFGRTDGEVRLNTSIPWGLRLFGGASRLTVNLSGVELTELELAGGLSYVTVTLGRPNTLVPIRISGGANNVEIRRPAGVGVRLEGRGGMSNLRLDGDRIGPSANLLWSSRSGHDSPNRYDIALRGGLSRLTLDETAEPA